MNANILPILNRRSLRQYTQEPVSAASVHAERWSRA